MRYVQESRSNVFIFTIASSQFLDSEPFRRRMMTIVEDLTHQNPKNPDSMWVELGILRNNTANVHCKTKQNNDSVGSGGHSKERVGKRCLPKIVSLPCSLYWQTC